MDSFTLRQTRYSVSDTGGNLSYRIDLSCAVIRESSSKVVLTPDVFVYTTDTSTEADVSSGGSLDGNFRRVATVADLSSLPTSREEALSNNKSEYRLRVLQLSMPDLETAVNSIPVIVDRVNALVTTYIEYQNNFYSEIPAEYTLPTASDSSVVNKYTSAYTTIREARKNAVLEQQELQLEFQALQAKNEILSSYKDELYSLLVAMSPTVADFQALASSASSTLSSTADVLPPSLKLLSHKSLLEALIQNRSGSLNSSIAQEGLLATQLEAKKKEVSLIEAQESAALSDLTSFCPDLNITSI